MARVESYVQGILPGSCDIEIDGGFFEECIHQRRLTKSSIACDKYHLRRTGVGSFEGVTERQQMFAPADSRIKRRFAISSRKGPNSTILLEFATVNPETLRKIQDISKDFPSRAEA